jgi:hypothetical protein
MKTIRFALVAGAILAFPLEANAGHDPAPSAEPAELPSGQCRSGETTVFAGEVQDDFGLGITVCMSNETLTVRYSGEGDPQVVSCRIGECAGIIDFDHYVRYRLTIITLVWRDKNGEMTLTESFDAQNIGEEPVHIITSTWSPPEARLADLQPDEYPVIAQTPPLSLMALSYRNRP